MSLVHLYAVQGRNLVPLPGHGQDVHNALANAPDGVYSALRSYDKYRFLRLDAHMLRCQRSLELAGYQHSFDFEGLRRAIDEAVRAHPSDEVRIRYDLLEQPWTHGGVSAHVLLAVAPHEPVAADILRQGAQLALAPKDLKRRQPLIKFTRWVHDRSVCQQQQPEAYEHLLLDERECILEGISSNFFAVRDGGLITAGERTLQGITQRLVIELAEQLGHPTLLQRLPLVELAACEEAFITSSTREIVPVVGVAAQRVGNAKPGPIVQALRKAYDAYAITYAKPAWPS